jgi:hypothetical protein
MYGRKDERKGCAEGRKEGIGREVRKGYKERRDTRKRYGVAGWGAG